MTSVVKSGWTMAVYYFFLLYHTFIEEAPFEWLLGRGGTTFIGNLTLDQNYALTTDHSMPGDWSLRSSYFIGEV